MAPQRPPKRRLLHDGSYGADFHQRAGHTQPADERRRHQGRFCRGELRCYGPVAGGDIGAFHEEHRPLHDVRQGGTGRGERGPGVLEGPLRLDGHVTLPDEGANRIDGVLAANIDGGCTRRYDGDVTERGT